MAIQSDKIKAFKVGLEKKLAEAVEELVGNFEFETGIIVEDVVVNIEHSYPSKARKGFVAKLRLDL